MSGFDIAAIPYNDLKTAQVDNVCRLDELKRRLPKVLNVCLAISTPPVPHANQQTLQAIHWPIGPYCE
jgi:hypothetical protein